ncbi:type 2 lanthipeptide synthetase LanM [Streptomyces phyllanthi]|uniref:type 2 lanthipeptide synthetase LanM n=1 Tax=Streptomyces phyllanthi TaxID=1803180 RepID=UPI0018844E49|nr:type 2 lanthipeptide synthetase LanM [Streptomyces phyllanthi]
MADLPDDCVHQELLMSGGMPLDRTGRHPSDPRVVLAAGFRYWGVWTMAIETENHTVKAGPGPVGGSAERAVRARHGIFGEFYLPALRRFDRELRAGFANRTDLLADVDTAVDAACQDLLGQLLELCVRTVIHEFYTTDLGVAAGGPESTARYEAFARYLGADGTDRILASYPVLDGLIEDTVRNRVRLLETALAAFAADHADLRPLGVPPDVRISSIQCSTGDSHNGGQKVLIVELTGERKIVYKPRSCCPESVMARLAGMVNQELPATHAIRFPRLVARDGHGWHEYVEDTGESSGEQVERFFFRAGVLLGLFSAIGSTDMHFENLIARADEPLIIDLETFVQHLPRHTEQTLNAAFARKLQGSVMGTMLLPARVAGELFDIDMSGLGNPRERPSETWNTYRIAHPGTDAVRFEKIPLQRPAAKNVPMVDGQSARLQDHVGQLVEGFEAGMSALRSRYEEIRDVLTDPQLAGAPVRQVLRPTGIYARFLEAASHPSYLGTEQARRALFAKIPPLRHSDPAVGQAVLDAELEALLANDVPYFTCPFGGTSVLGNQVGLVSDYYTSTLRDQVLTRFDTAVGTSTLENRMMIHHAVLASTDDTWDRCEEDSPTHVTDFFTKSGTTQFAESVADYLCDIAVWDGAGRNCTWVSPRMLDKSRVMLNRHDFSLYQDGGSVLFLATMADITGDERYARTAFAAAVEDKSMFGSVCAFSGLPSSVYLYSELAALLPGEKLAQRRDEHLRLLSHWDIRATTEDDYVGGLSGAGVVLANLYEQRELPQLEKILTDIGARLADRARQDDMPSGRLAHGDLGLYLAMARIGKVRADSALSSAAADGLARILDRLPPTGFVTGNDLSSDMSWCKGVPGLLHAGTQIMADLGHTREEVSTAFMPMVDAVHDRVWSVNHDISLCHGLAGQYESLVRACRLAGDERRELALRESFAKVLARIPETGYRGGLAHSTGLPTFMLGLSGLAQTALTLRMPDLPSAPLFGLRQPAGGRSA